MKKIFLLPILCLFIWKTNCCFSQELPITPTRTIAFTTDEGTHMDVDISPNGKVLVFDLLGDLYTMPVTGGKAIQLTRGMAINCDPTWSPNGKEIAYLSDGSGSMHINVRDISGKFHHVLESATGQIDFGNTNTLPVWSSDGHYVAINDTLFGTISGKIALPVHIQKLLRFSPEGHTAYGLDSGSIFKYNMERNTRAHISSQFKLSDFQSIALSPDARWCAYTADSNEMKRLVVMDLVNHTEKVLIPFLVKDKRLTPTEFQHFAFSPDSRFIYIGYGGKIHRIEVQSGNNKIIPFSANVKVDMGPLDYNAFRVTHDPLQVKYCRSASVSPNGKHLVFAALDHIYLKDLPKGKPHILCPQTCNQFQPAWSPDGKWITYVSWCDRTGGFLWRVRTNGTQLQNLTPIAGQYRYPTWSPDGTLIAAVKGGPSYSTKSAELGYGLDMDMGIGQLQLVQVKGLSIEAIADSIPLRNQVSFSPDGRRLIYGITPTDKSSPMVVSKDINKKDIEILTFGDFLLNGGQLHTTCHQRMVSPDGRYLVYSRAEDLYLVPLSRPATALTASWHDSQRPQAIRFAPGVDPHWEQNGKVLSWTYGNQFFSVDPQQIIRAAESPAVAKSGDIVNAPVKPDRVIRIDLRVPKYFAKGTIALTDTRILTMQGNKVIRHGTILIRDGHIVAVGPASSVRIPRNAKIINLNGKTVMPGLVNLHLHQGAPSDIFPKQWPAYLSNLAFGVTTMRDPASSIDSYGYTELLETGQMIGPRLYSSGNPVRRVGYYIEINNFGDAQSIAQKRKALGGTFIKQYLIYNDESTRQKKEWLLKAAREAGLNMTNEGEYNLLLAFGQLKDGSSGIEHNPDWVDAYNDVITLFARSGTYFTPTLNVRPGGFEYFDYKYWSQSDPKLAYFDPDFSDQVKAAIRQPDDTVAKRFLYSTIVDAAIRKQGGRVAMGTDGNKPIYAHSELWALKMGGLTNMQALQAATIMGARAIGIQKDVGSIEVGKIADLIILNKNPLEDIHNSREIKYVMKDGILYDADTLDEIWPVAKKCPEWKLKQDTIKKSTN